MFDGRAAIYARISRDASGEGEGVARQEARCRDEAKRLNLEVVDVWVDNDIGASEKSTKKDRPGFQQLLTNARQGLYTHILATETSRFTRRPAELELLIDLVENHKVRIVALSTGEVDLQTGMGLTVARILAAIDAGEARAISSRQKATYLHKALQGKPKLQRQRPFGWEKDGKTIRAEEAELVRKAVKDVIAGKTITAIAREWEAKGIPTASGGLRWEWSPLHKILTGWRTAGVRTYQRKEVRDADGKLVMGAWEPIITLEEREAALAALKVHALVKRRQGKWLLKGLVRCAECGGKMYGARNDVPALQTYQCKSNGHNAITADKLEWLVVSAVTSRLLKKAAAEAESEGLEVAVEPEEFPQEKRLGEIDQKISELMEAYRSGALDFELAIPNVDELNREKKSLQKQREDFLVAQAQRRMSVTSSEEIWSAAASELFEASDEEKARVIARELDAVVVKKGERGRAGWGTERLLERLSFEWRGENQTMVGRVARGPVTSGEPQWDQLNHGEGAMDHT